MITRRAFAKSLGGTVALVTLKPVLGRASGELQASTEASRVYRNAFVLDCNALAYLVQLADPGKERMLKGVRESGINVVKSTLPIRFYLEVGVYDLGAAMLGSNRELRDVLQLKGYKVDYREFDGGHNFANWRGTLADGLISVLDRKSTRLNSSH